MELPHIQGLTSDEARRLAEEGKTNALPSAGGNGVGKILKRNIFTLFNLLNLVLAAALIAVGRYRDMMFMGVVLSNILIGTVQELRAKRTHDRLLLLAQNPVRVIRDGAETKLPAEELVLGDVVLLRRGEQIPADAVVLSGNAQADESLLTGESVPIDKCEGDTLYSGCFLNSGSVAARLNAVGAQSVAGKLQIAARKVKRSDSKLMTDMKRIIRWVSIAIVPMGALLFAKQYWLMSMPINESIAKTVASVLGMIPEGLILLTSVSLAAGVVKLGGKRALVNELYGIESLARTDVVCMDKTGTLTSGEMKLQKTVLFGDYGETDIAQYISALISTFKDETPTNRALTEAFGRNCGEAPLCAVPFSSERKWSAASFDGLGAIIMGAPERLLSGEKLDEAKSIAAQGLRVMALMHCAKPCDFSEKTLPDGLEPVALVCLRDELRARVTDTIRYFGEQGVKLKVISGDSPLTVSAVAAQAGVPDADKYIDLSMLEAPLNYERLSREYTVFGRVSPDDKRELVEAMKRDGHGVAMIGDGVNDIPALKAADCSIAMAGGSDAACRVSHITLLNADFEAMPGIVLEGRRVINNITRAASLFLIKNIFSLLLSLALLALPYAYPFVPIQLTLVSSLTVGFPSFVLALQPSRERVRGDFIRNVIARAIPGGVCVALICIAVVAFGGRLGCTGEQTATLCTLITGYSGLVALLLICLPLNALRGGLLALVTVLLTAAVLLFPGVFYLTGIGGSQPWVLVCAAVLAPILQLALGAAVKRVRSGRSQIEVET